MQMKKGRPTDAKLFNDKGGNGVFGYDNGHPVLLVGD